MAVMRISRKTRIGFYGLAAAAVLAGVFFAGATIKGLDQATRNPAKIIPLSKSPKIEDGFITTNGGMIPPAKRNESSSREPVFIDVSKEAIASWDTCRNEKYGYEFKYPKGWYVYSDMPDKAQPELVNSCAGTNIIILRKPFGEVDNPKIGLRVLTQDWTKSVEEYFNEEVYKEPTPYSIDYYRAKILKQGKLDGREWLIYSGRYANSLLIRDKTTIFILYAFNGYTEQKTGLPTLLNAVFSTFKFID